VSGVCRASHFAFALSAFGAFSGFVSMQSSWRLFAVARFAITAPSRWQT
jgi:hypothetical protein